MCCLHDEASSTSCLYELASQMFTLRSKLIKLARSACMLSLLTDTQNPSDTFPRSFPVDGKLPTCYGQVCNQLAKSVVSL